MALDVLRLVGLAMWLVLAVAGAWHLITGRHIFLGLPRGFRKGWPVRLVGLAFCFMAALLLVEGLTGWFNPAATAFALAAVMVGLVVVSIRGQSRGASGTRS
ncbi:MAG: hypothetical protein NVS1B3_00480 [Candidatus Dormibacteraceae bacterium]